MKTVPQLKPILLALRRFARLPEVERYRVLEELYDADPYSFKVIPATFRKYLELPVMDHLPPIASGGK